MSVAQSSRCLFCKWTSAPSRAAFSSAAQRQFHSSPARQSRRRPGFQNVKAADYDRAKTAVADAPDALASKIPGTLSADRADASIETTTNTNADVLSGSLGITAGSSKSRRHGIAALNKAGDEKFQARSAAKKAQQTQLSQLFEQYSPREQQLLALKYSPEQLRALEAAEKSINIKDIVSQGKMRNDPMRIEYKDDYSKILPLIDFPTRAPDEDIDPDIRPLTAKETRARFAEWFHDLAARQAEHERKSGVTSMNEEQLEDIRSGIEAGVYPGDGQTPEERMAKLRAWAQEREGIDMAAEFERFASDPSNFFHSPRGLLHRQSTALSDPLPRMEDPRITTEMESDEPAHERLELQTGLNKEQLRGINVKILVSHGVSNQTRMGKIHSQYYLAVAGDGKGMLGIGEGKGTEGGAASLKARMMAIRNMRPIPRYEDRTIFGEVEGKVGASIVKLSARPPGFGNRCQYLIFEMARAAGIKDLSARCLRSRNKMNVVKAAYAALMAQKLPEEVARARGRKMVDVRKVYYEGETA